MKKRNYREFLQEAAQCVPQERIYTDELRRLAWGTDAGFYRLLPRIVIRSANEQEVVGILRAASRHSLPVTFRAAGTSLSGQAISDSILVIAGKHWEGYSVSADHRRITLQPGIIGQRVNEILQPLGRKFAPDPASVRSAMVGGIVMNNASGMNCGTHANSDRVLLSARLVLADGTVLDTGQQASRWLFRRTHAPFLRRIEELRDSVRSNRPLAERIRYKYSIKNVTGLNIRPFIDYDDPFDIIAHLLVGSEGTLAFLSEVTMQTEYDYPCRASAMLYFKDIKEACRAVQSLTPNPSPKERGEQMERLVHAAELFDEKSLASVNDPVYLQYKAEKNRAHEAEVTLTALLLETKARTPEELNRHITAICAALAPFDTYIPVHFTDRPEEYARYWAIRSGIFPSVGGTRPLGTTCLIEDVAFHIKDLPEATAELQQLIARHGYTDACIYGHALEGNYHFIINQSFGTPAEVKRYEALMEEVKELVVTRYDGSLKAEHGTGRNMAPFVRYEWGDEAFALMQAVKELFDPQGLLNPGVIFNDDPQCHIKDFKPLPILGVLSSELGVVSAANSPLTTHYSTLNKCIECGFCEVNCLTCGFTLSSRQRIVVQREISRLRQSGEDAPRLATLERQYRYPGNATCAGDGLCSMSCPMSINTGDLTHALRGAELPPGSLGYRMGNFAANHFAGVKSTLRPLLTLADTAHWVLGTTAMSALTRKMHQVLGIPLWTPAMPKSLPPRPSPKERGEKMASTIPNAKERLTCVYFPSCINQTMGLPRSPRNAKVTSTSPLLGRGAGGEAPPLIDTMLSLLHKAGYEVIFPAGMEKLCCGTIWESKGMIDIADRKSAELEAALWEASEQGRYPILCDQSPCLHRMRTTMKKMKLYEPAEFIYTFLRDRLDFAPTNRPVALHITCSMRRMGLADTIVALARLCSTRVFVPDEVGCCGFAGDKGFTHPEVNRYALRKLRPQLEGTDICTGYSNSRTCEIGLTTHAGIPYISIAYLIDECSVASGLTPTPSQGEEAKIDSLVLTT